MPEQKRHQSYRLRLLWTAALVATAGLALALSMLGSWAEDRVRASLEARTYVERFQNAVIDAERAQRGFLLSQDQSYLADYNYALLRSEELKKQLTNSLARNQLNLPAVEELYRLSGERSRELDGAIEVFNTQGLQAAIQRVQENEVSQTTQQILDLTVRIDEDENRLLERRQDQLTWSRMLLLAVLLSVMAGTVAVSSSALSNERRLAAELSRLANELEARVRERTMQLEAEKRRVEHVLGDLSHRVGNNLALISSQLLLQARRTQDDSVRATLEDVNRRILSVASAQRRLQVNTSSGQVETAAYLSLLVNDLQTTLLPKGVSIDLKASPISLRSDEVVALGVIVNELVINAIKHAFPNGEGNLSVELQHTGHEAVLSVSDDGHGIGDNIAEGLGSLVVRSMVSAISAKSTCIPLRRHPTRPGTKWVVTFPLSEVMPTPYASDDRGDAREPKILH